MKTKEFIKQMENHQKWLEEQYNKAYELLEGQNK